jgi:hypothetical protein
MSTPLSASKFLDHLLSYGVRVHEHGEWRTHNRNQKGAWGPVQGVMLHHTVTKGTSTSLGIVTSGYEGLPGPLCHGLIDKDGAVYLIGYGRANHAGLGDQSVLNAVIAERSALPDPQHQTVDGNSRFYGFECINMGDGKDPWPEAQIDAMCRVSAALCDAHKWTERSVIGHKEWQTGKVDPRGLSMDTMRTRIKAQIGKKEERPVVDLSDLVRAALTNPPAVGTPVTYSGVKTVEASLVAEGLLKASLADGHYGTATVTAYAAWQRKCHFSGRDADGIPGLTSLKLLAEKHDFAVRA